MASGNRPTRPRYHHTFYAGHHIRAVCQRCGGNGLAANLPTFASVAEAIDHLTADGWARITDAEPAHVRPYDQRWRCPRCINELRCRTHGHAYEVAPLSIGRLGTRYSAHLICRRCDTTFGGPTVTRPPALLAWLYRLCSRLAAADLRRAERRADPLF
ncbi:hypothetical protein ACIBG7_40320 [Nonomuraea sp. NPDC050328]|uniref:hypothetical protein n=1 Tax=Nonomuraea sp. NPDC050328 TaxID=3364361 RepID=UPI0037916A5B